ncbi:MAG: TIGR04076 family protein [Candidatus Heimdallarchaeota archaeon]
MTWKEPVFKAKIVSIKKNCSAGHKVGDTFEINTHKTGGICGWCYHDLFPTLMTLAMGGAIPWRENQDEFTYECPDRHSLVTFRIMKIPKK